MYLKQEKALIGEKPSRLQMIKAFRDAGKIDLQMNTVEEVVNVKALFREARRVRNETRKRALSNY